jgi:hypothetical protein
MVMGSSGDDRSSRFNGSKKGRGGNRRYRLYKTGTNHVPINPQYNRDML